MAIPAACRSSWRVWLSSVRSCTAHANVQITLDTYSHVIPGLDEQAAATVARLILEGSETASMGAPGSDAANSAAKTGDAPHPRKEVRGEVPGELGGGGGI